MSDTLPVVTDPVVGDPTTTDAKPLSLRAAGLVGVGTGVVALGVASLMAQVIDLIGLRGGTPDPVQAVGGAFVDRTPTWLKNFAVSTFGTADKLVLFIGMGVTLVAVFVAIGVLARRRLGLAQALVAVIGAVGVAAVLSRPNATPTDVVPTAIGAAAAVAFLGWAMRSSIRDGRLSRRAVIVGGLTGVAAFATPWGSFMPRAVPRETLTGLPPLATPTAAADLGIEGVTPYIVPTKDFYRIDTALLVPRVEAESWTIKVTGMVEREVTMDWQTLLSQDLQTELVTLTCVSNEVGGPYIGNAAWTGWPIRELLAMAGPLPDADMVLSRSADGWTASTPLDVLTDDRNALLAVAMNGASLPAEHGYPVRMVVPGLYGYVSATKWVVELKVTRFDQDVAYWTPRGWSARGPIKTSARIDVPRFGVQAPVTNGTAVIAGVAWAQHRGISKVEVKIDDGPWLPARLAGEPTVDSWRQWVLEWDATPGSHTATVRATDSTGAVQVAQEAPPEPDGATGYHTVMFTV